MKKPLPPEGVYYDPLEDRLIFYYRGLTLGRVKSGISLSVVNLYEVWVNYHPEPKSDKFVLTSDKFQKIVDGEWPLIEATTLN